MLEAREQNLDQGSQEEFVRSLIDKNPELKDAFAKLSRLGVVVHPALHGREMAWTAVRVDFWFRKIKELIDEAELVSKEQSPPALRLLEKEADLYGGTWQFFELNSSIAVNLDATKSFREILVRAKSIPDKLESSIDLPATSFFSVSLFTNTESEGTVRVEVENDEEPMWRLADNEKKVQDLLNWLASRHHDFIRLNDFSESLSILRWLGQNKSTLKIVDLNGKELALLTPDRVLDEGPAAGKSK